MALFVLENGVAGVPYFILLSINFMHAFSTLSMLDVALNFS